MTRRRLVGVGAAAAILVAAVIVLNPGRRRPSPRIIDIEMRTSAGTFAQMFWGQDLAFIEEHSMRIPLERGVEGFQRLRFFLPSDEIRWLRFDPMETSGEALIQRMQLTDSHGRLLKTFRADDLRPANDIAAIFQEGDRIRVVTVPRALDPVVQVSFGCDVPPSLADDFHYVTPVSLAVMSVAAAVFLAACLIVLGADAFAPGAGAPAWRGTALWLAMLFLLVFSGKLLLMREHAVTGPFWDQWDGEARAIYVPYSACGLSWRSMFALHNEHRVFFTRLLALDLLGLNRQWDPRVQQVASAALHSLTAVLLAVMLWLANGRRRLELIAFFVGLAFALPFAWHNTLFGFQSAFYFMLIFSVLGLWLTTSYEVLSVPWVLGWICALCALFTAAGGVLLLPIIALVTILKWLSDRRMKRGALLSLAAVAILLVVGFLTASPPLAHHAMLRAQNAADFGVALAHNLAWPWVNSAPLSVVMWLPIATLLVVVARNRVLTTAIERFVLGLAAWVGLQAAAIAFGRGAGGAVPDGRYEDFFSIGFVANAIALGLVVLTATRERTRARRLAILASIAWLVVAGVGLNIQVDHAMIELNSTQRYLDIQTRNVRRFVRTGELSQFINKRAPEIPYPDAGRLVTVLQDPYIRQILPASVRQPVHLEPQSVTNAAFSLEGTYPIVPRDALSRVWGSYTVHGNGAVGTFESQPLDCQTGGYLMFDVSGYVGMTRETLALKDVQSDRQSAIRPSVWPREDWLRVVVRCPSRPFTVLASDARSDYWMAFREPVETGRMAPAAEWLIDTSPTLLLVAFVLGVLAARQS